MAKKQKAYAQAGVDIALADKLLNRVKPHLKKASRPESQCWLVQFAVHGAGDGQSAVSRQRLDSRGDIQRVTLVVAIRDRDFAAVHAHPKPQPAGRWRPGVQLLHRRRDLDRRAHAIHRGLERHHEIVADEIDQVAAVRAEAALHDLPRAHHALRRPGHSASGRAMRFGL